MFIKLSALWFEVIVISFPYYLFSVKTGSHLPPSGRARVGLCLQDADGLLLTQRARTGALQKMVFHRFLLNQCYSVNSEFKENSYR